MASAKTQTPSNPQPKLPITTNPLGKALLQTTESQRIVRMFYLVDMENGPFFTIQSAIDIASPGSTIKISSGLYKENLVITTKNLRIEAKDMSPDVYIMGMKGPALLIDVDDRKDNIIIQNLKFLHKGGAPSRGNKRDIIEPIDH